MRTDDWLPVVVAGTAAAAVCYIAYNQASNAVRVSREKKMAYD